MTEGARGGKNGTSFLGEDEDFRDGRWQVAPLEVFYWASGHGLKMQPNPY